MKTDLKLGNKVKIVKGIAKSEDIYAVTSIPFEVCGSVVVHLENIETGEVKHAYDVTFLAKVEDSNDKSKRN